LTAADLPLGEHSENSLGNAAVVDRSGAFFFLIILLAIPQIAVFS
jgi:hypothetical protein